MLMVVQFEDIGGRRAVVGPMPSSVKEWGAIVSRDPDAPGGLSREFLKKDRGGYAMMLPALKVGQVIEWGGKGKKGVDVDRHFWTVVSLGFRGMLVDSLTDKDETSEALKLGLYALRQSIGEAIAVCCAFSSIPYCEMHEPGATRLFQPSQSEEIHTFAWIRAASDPAGMADSDRSFERLIGVWNFLVEVIATEESLASTPLSIIPRPAPVEAAASGAVERGRIVDMLTGLAREDREAGHTTFADLQDTLARLIERGEHWR